MSAAYSFGAPGVKHSDGVVLLAEPRVGTLSCLAMKLRLASASPRRRELLDAIGLGFDVTPGDVDEQAAAGSLAPLEAATAVATAKAHALAPRDGTVVLAADTMVVLDDRVIGKPADDADAQRMLASLRGRTHTVVTAVVVQTPDTRYAAAIESRVRMRGYSDAEIDEYVASGAGRDKAGSYGIQDAPFLPVEAIEGCYCNVMGLPLWNAYRLLREAGCTAPRRPSDVLARCAVCPMRP